MSRTDKTNPWWYDSEWEPLHNIRCPHYTPRRFGSMIRDAQFVCDLPEDPPKRRLTESRMVRFPPRNSRCYWWPDTVRYYSRQGIKYYGRPRHVKEQGNLIERGIRAAWIVYRQKVIASRVCVEGIAGCPCLFDAVDEIDLPDPRHRRFALWDIW